MFKRLIELLKMKQPHQPILQQCSVMCSCNYRVINDGCFYKKGTLLIKDKNGLFAPLISDYPSHCHFLTDKFISSKPMVFRKECCQA